MKGSTMLKAGLALVGLLLGGSLYGSNRQRKRDKLATELLRKLSPELNIETEGLLAEDAFDIYYKDKVKRKIKGQFFVLKTSLAAKLAKDIYDSWGWFNDDEEKIFNVFRSLKDKVAVSQVARAYSSNHNANLIDALSADLTESELKTIRDIVRDLPAYRQP